MSKPGPQPFLDDGKRREICAMLVAGASQTSAANYVGCVTSTITNMAKRDPEFARQIQRARAECELNSLNKINAAGDRSWRAAAWILERTRPESYEKVNLRQPTYERIAGFWDDCSEALLENVPEEKRQQTVEKLHELAGRFRESVNMPPLKEAGGEGPFAKPDNGRMFGDPEGFGDEERATRFMSGMLDMDQAGVREMIRRLPGSSSPMATPAQWRQRAEALEGMEKTSVEHYKWRQANRTPAEIEADRLEELRLAQEYDAGFIFELRERRAEILAARQVGDMRPEPNWTAELKQEQIPPRHPAYQEFALPLVEWGMLHADGKFASEWYEAAVWACREPQGSASRRSAAGDATAARENKEMRKPGGKERKSEGEKGVRERQVRENGVSPEPRGLSPRKGPEDDVTATQQDQGIRMSGREGQNDSGQNNGLGNGKAVAVALLAMLIPLLTLMLGGLVFSGPAFQSRLYAVAISPRESLPENHVHKICELEVCNEVSPDRPGKAGPRGAHVLANVATNTEEFPILEQNPSTYLRGAFKDRGGRNVK